ncbi:MAG: PD-(D/E)XK nuclease family protein, partial [Pseudomonadota bacterium]
LMKHPLTASGPEARGPHLGRVARLETVLRAEAGPRVTPALLAATEGVDAAWLAPLFEAHPDHMLSDIVARHIAMAEHIAAGPEGAPHQLWQEAAGEEAQRLMEELTSAAPHGGALGLRDYPPLIRGILAGATVPEAAFAPDPRIAIWGPLEARTQTADLVILGGLNEGTWPRLADPDPWLGREMRSALGLPLPERRIGLSAHDVQQAGNAKRVVLSRAIRDGEAPTVPARWLLRLTNLMQGLDGPMAAMRAKGTRLVDMAARLDGRESAPSATRPAPVPPRDSVPDQLSVTGVERLARDPYQIYALHVLRLKPLRPLRREADALERGTVLHAVLKTFIDRTAETLPENAAEILRSTAAEVIGAEVPWPAAGTLWTALFDRIAERFAVEEAERRHLAQPFAREVEGALTLPFAPPFTLIAKADRVDRAPDGRLYIYDYKSGKPPTGNKLTHYKQLSLEGLIAQDGGFQGVPAGKIAALTLLGLKDGETKNLEDAKALDRVAEELALLIGAYRDGAGFAARRRPDLLGDWPGDYDHLARLGEWLDGDDAVEVRL